MTRKQEFEHKLARALKGIGEAYHQEYRKAFTVAFARREMRQAAREANARYPDDDEMSNRLAGVYYGAICAVIAADLGLTDAQHRRIADEVGAGRSSSLGKR